MNQPEHDHIEPPHPDLSKISGEMRALRIPEVDAEKIEDGLFARLAKEPAPDRRRGGFLSLPLAAAAIAAAALGYLVLRPAGTPAPSASLGTPPLAAVVAPADVASASAVATGRSVWSADAEELRVVREGLATMVLEPGSSVRVVRDDDVLTVDLERGAIRAYVVPRVEKERVVVLSNGVRVAVHGTVFRVARAGASTDVDLLRGTISLGTSGQAAGGPANAPQIVEAPRGFTVTAGAFDARPVKSFVELAGPWLEGRPTKPLATDKSSAKGRDEALRARVTSIANECFQRETSRLAPGVDVQVQSTIAVTVGEGGRVANVAFGNALAPGLEACIRGALKTEKGPPGITDVSVSLARR